MYICGWIEDAQETFTRRKQRQWLLIRHYTLEKISWFISSIRLPSQWFTLRSCLDFKCQYCSQLQLVYYGVKSFAIEFSLLIHTKYLRQWALNSEIKLLTCSIKLRCFYCSTDFGPLMVSHCLIMCGHIKLTKMRTWNLYITLAFHITNQLLYYSFHLHPVSYCLWWRY